MPLLKSKRSLLAILLLAVGAAGFGVWYALRPPYYHWVEVVPGKVYRSGVLKDDLASAIDRFHLKTVIDLRDTSEYASGDWHATELRVTTEKGVRLVEVPLPVGTPPTPEQVKQLLAVFDDPNTTPVLMHCDHGVTRSAGVEGMYRREYLGETGEEALAHVSRQKAELATKYPLVAAFVRGYVPRATKPPAPK